jgi:putative transferase (TIGR04331 family)
VLVTTALEKTWPDDPKAPVLFLGEWCRLFSRKERWSMMNAIVAPYHWDNRKKLYHDYLYISKLYESVLVVLADRLNNIHHVDHGLRYWRILVGPWLGYFLQMLFDRWFSINQVIERFEISRTKTLLFTDEDMIPNGMDDFLLIFLRHEWNHYVYTQILTNFSGKICIENQRVNKKVKKTVKDISNEIPFSNKCKQIFKHLLFDQGLARLRRNTDCFFASTYLPLKTQLNLELKLRQIPQRWNPLSIPAKNICMSERQWKLSFQNANDFESLVEKILVKQIPVNYLEGYSTLVDSVDGSAWPKKPKLIWTSNRYNADDSFKLYAAEKVENGSKLVIGQHGGHYGTGKWSFLEDHELAISDQYLSWGWQRENIKHIFPLGQLKLKRPLFTNHSKQLRALLVTCTMPQYSYHMYSTMVASQWLNYLEDQFCFIEKLPEKIQDQVTVRMITTDYGWDQKKRWLERFPKLKLDDGNQNIDNLVKQSRLLIGTYNATTFLESFVMDIPTIIFWNPEHWELCETAMPHYEMLELAGIFHHSPESAAIHIAKIWDDIDSWWNSEIIKNAVINFKEHYIKDIDKPVSEISKLFRQITSDNISRN